MAPYTGEGNHLPHLRPHARDFDLGILGREVEVCDAGQDERLGPDGAHGGSEVAVVGRLPGDVAGLSGVEHGEEVFGVCWGDWGAVG
jgi:hypothetical protein